MANIEKRRNGVVTKAIEQNMKKNYEVKISCTIYTKFCLYNMKFAHENNNSQSKIEKIYIY